MSDSEKQPQLGLGEADAALETLLGNLLADVPDYQKPLQKPAQVKPVDSKPTPAVQPVVHSVAPETRQSKASPAVAQAEVTPVVTKDPAAAPIVEKDTASALPVWAKQPFKVLVVQVGNLRVAVPLLMLNGIAPLQANQVTTNMPGQPAWHRGVMRHRQSKLVLMDLARLLDLRAGEQQPSFLLLIGDGQFGVQCDALEEPVEVEAQQVDWRAQSGKNDWKFGMLREQMCVLLDPEGITARVGRAAVV